MTIDTRQQLLGTINSQIKLNGTGAITGPILNNVLDTMVNSALFQTGAWSQYTSYAPLDVVEYLGNAYIANVANVNASPVLNPTTWTPFSSNAAPTAANVSYTAPYTGAVTETVQAKLAQTVSVKDFGAVGDGVTNDTAAIQSAVNTGKNIYFPNGTYLIGQITIPSGVCLVGETLSGVIISPYGTISSLGLFYLNTVSFVEISNFTFLSAYPTSSNPVAINVANGNNNYIHDIYINAYDIGVVTTNTTDSNFERITVTSGNNIGIYISGSSSYRNKVLNCTVLHATISHGIQINGGQDNQISACECTDAKIFGISIYNTNNAIVSNNTIWNTIKEGINLENSNNCIVVNNNIYWTSTSISTDFGLSLFGADPSENNNFNIISGNSIGGSGKSGIACAQHCQFNIIQDNTIINPNTLNTSDGAGILIYGIGGGNNFVTGNTLYNNSGYMYYGINDNDGITFGKDVITNNWVTGAITANVKKNLSSVEALNTYSYTAYTPTVTSQVGTITSYTATGGYYEVGKMVYFTVSVTITNAGTGSGGINISLPFTNNSTFYGTVSGRESTGGKGIDGVISLSGTTALVFFYDNATTIVTGNNLIISGFYQRA